MCLRDVYRSKLALEFAMFHAGASSCEVLCLDVCLPRFLPLCGACREILDVLWLEICLPHFLFSCSTCCEFLEEQVDGYLGDNPHNSVHTSDTDFRDRDIQCVLGRRDDLNQAGKKT